MSFQLNNDNNPKHICKYSCHPFTHKRGLDAHYENGCNIFEGQNFNLPNKGDYKEFNKYNTKLKKILMSSMVILNA